MVLGLASIIDCKVWIIILLQLILASTLPIPGRVIRSHRRPKLLFYQKNHFWLVSGLYLAGFVLLFCLMKYILRKRRTCCGFDLQDDAEQQNDAEIKDSVTSKHQNNFKVTSSTEQNKSNGDKSKLPEIKRTDQAIHTTHEIERDVLMKNEKTLEQDSRHQPVPSVHKKSHSFKTADIDMKKERLVTATVHRILPTDNIKQISEYDEVDLMEKGLLSATNDHLPPTKAELIPLRKSPNHSPAPTMKTQKDTRGKCKSIQSDLDINTSVNRYPVNKRAPSLPRSPRYLNQSLEHTKAGKQNNQILEHPDFHNPQYRGIELQYNTNNQVENIRHTEKQIEEKPVNSVPLAEIVDEIIARRYRKFLKEEQLKDMCRVEKLAHPSEIQNPQTIQPKNVEIRRNNEVVIDMFSQATPGLHDNDIHKQYQNIQAPNDTKKLKINSWSQWSLQTIATTVNRWTQWSRQTLTPENEKWTQCSSGPSKDDQSHRPEGRVTDISYETVVQLDKSTQMSLNGLSKVDSWKYRPESQVTDFSYESAAELDKGTQMSLNSETTVDSWNYRPESQVTDLLYETAVQLDKSTQMSLNGISTVGSWNETESEMDLSNVSNFHNDQSTQWSIISENNDTDLENAESESSSDTSVNTVVNKTNYSQMSTGMSTEDLNVKCQYSTESTSNESEKKTIHSSSGEKTLKNSYDEKLSEDTYIREIMRHELYKEAEEEPKISKTFDIRSEAISAQSYYNLNNHKEKQSDLSFSKDQYEHYQNENDQIKTEYQKVDFNRHENTTHDMPQQSPPSEQDKSTTSNYYNLDGSNFSKQESRTSEVQDINARVNTEDNIKERFSLAQAKETDFSSIEVRTSDTHRGSTGTNHPTMYITDKEYTAQYPIGESNRRESIYHKKVDSISNNVIGEATIGSEQLESGNNEISAVKHANGKRRKCLTFCCCCSFKHEDSEKDNESTTETELQEVTKIPEERIWKLDDSLAMDSDSETIISAQSIALRKSFLNDRVISRQTSSINSVEASSEINSCNSYRSSPCTNNMVQQWLAQQRSRDHQANSREIEQSGISSCIRISGRDAADSQEQVESYSSTSVVLSAVSNNSARGILDNKLGRLWFKEINTAHHEDRTRDLIGKELKEPYRISYNISGGVEIFPSSTNIDKKKEYFSQKIAFINSSEKLEKEQKNVATHLVDSLPLHTLDKGTNTNDEFNNNVSVTGQDDTKRVETLVCNRVRISFSYQRPRLFRFPRTRRWFNQMRQRWREYRSRNETRDIPVVTPHLPNKSAHDIPD